MSKRHRFRALAGLFGACITAIGSMAGAQSVRGTVVDSASGQPVSDFVAVLLDARGGNVTTMWSRDGGRFFVQAPAAGTFSIRIQRLGFRKTTTAAFTLATTETRELRISLPRVPVSLTAVHVSENARCEAIPADGAGDVAAVWETARNAFELIALSATRRDLGIRVLDQSTDLALRGDSVTRSVDTEREGRSLNPYPSIGPDSIARFGYIRQVENAVWYYAPDANILLSPQFLRDHCFHLARSSSHDSTEIGIAFEPPRDRRLADVKGIMWMDRATAEPRSLDFSYTSLPPAARNGDFGGHVEFLHVPDGGWLSRRWIVRAPIINVAQHTRPSVGAFGTGGSMAMTRVADSVLTGTRVEAGRIVLVRASDDKVLWAEPLGAIAGTVRDSSTREPIRDVQLLLRGSPRQARSDAAGRFILDSLIAGPYDVTARIARFGYPLLSATVHVTLSDSSRRIDVMLPLARAISDAFDAQRDAVKRLCSTLRTQRERELDAEFRMTPDTWHPTGPDSSTIAQSVHSAAVVLEGIADTTGAVDLENVRVLKGGAGMIFRAAYTEITDLRITPDEPEPGCRIRHLVILPYRSKRE